MKHAWTNYKTYAWEADELKPISLQKRNWMTSQGLAATLFDSLDTLWIMGMKEEFQEALEVALKFNFDQVIPFAYQKP